MPRKDTAAQITPEMNELLVKSGNGEVRVAHAAQHEFAQALQEPLRQAVIDGPITGDIFTPIPFTNASALEFPLDFVVPGTESQYTAYTIPNAGRIPEKHIEGDYVMVPTFRVGAAIDWDLKYARDARWDIVARAMEVFQAMFMRKMNSDAWKVLIAAGVDRNLLVYDSNAPAGFLTKRLISLAKTTFRRSGGGNLSSLNNFKLTDLYLSPEGLEDIRSWDLTMIDDVTRREIFLAEGNGGITSLFGVRLHDLIELGVGSTFQNYYSGLGGTYASSDTELAIGLDQTDSAGSSFVMPMREPMQMFNDEYLHRSQRQGVYGWQEHGFGVLDNRKIVILTY